MRAYTARAVTPDVTVQVAALRARIAETDPVRLLQRDREWRLHSACPTCARGDTSAAAIAHHNLRCSESGERRYPRWGPRPREGG